MQCIIRIVKRAYRVYLLIFLGMMGALSYADIELTEPQPWPSVACTLDELERLRNACASGGPEHEVVMERVRQVELALKHDMEFPPERGRHNQWYQCDQCQLALETVDDTHHCCPKCGRVYSGYP